MHYIMIENKGELDVSSLILLGASTKRADDSKIGFFGSGNKYAIATLIRLGVSFKIFSGNKEIAITTTGISFRGQTFEQIHIDGQPTSLTTDMGPQWDDETLYYNGYRCELPSDDDGFFYFYPYSEAGDYDDSVCIRIPYPD